MTRKQKRLAGIAAIASVVALAATLAAIALRDEIVFFYEPTDIIVHQKVSPGQNFRVGGLVEEGSVDKSGTVVSFREGQGVIAEGQLNASGQFVASNVLAKHDEKYIPRELQDVLKDKNVWQGESQ